ncbi:hypothetical protein LA99_19145 [Salmonella enterica]|uniref:hypothetical protein n=1 Tax=Citrobacter koseri TaxID=545 RepID=UPI00107742AC|nr:hypothetical protein [Citrobacter koseri]EAA7007521.1 hypothetical protein [Salmonella enterica]EBP0680255.1 hypothetical protein [Salmonella enterica]EDV9342322.1 hypothetical protein [Salmonella enterica subsp. enterica]BDG92071.1 hypothetical protein TUM20903_48090 [Citrobacter koseri]
MKYIKYFLFIILFLAAIFFVFHKNELSSDELSDKAIAFATQAVKETLKDKESIITRNVSFKGKYNTEGDFQGAVCGEVSGNDEDGELAGYSYFVVKLKMNRKGDLLTMYRVLKPDDNINTFQNVCEDSRKVI